MEDSGRQEELRELKERLFGGPDHYREHPWEWEQVETTIAETVTNPCIHEYHELGGGRGKRFLKKVIRKLIRFYVVPMVEEQNKRNVEQAEAIKKLAHLICENQSSLQAENRRLRRELQWTRSRLPEYSHTLQREKLRVIQMLPALAFGDGIGNDTVALKGALQEAGYETEIYADYIDDRLPAGTARPIEEYREQPDDLVLYHLSTGSEWNYRFAELRCRKGVIYHNVTPPHFFAGTHPEPWKDCCQGVEAVAFLADKVDFGLADSDFNRQDLIRAGYPQPLETLPILIAFEDFEKEPDPAVLKRYQGDGYTNLIFTGRVFPHKKQEDIITAFYYYKKHYNPKSRLFLVGAHGGGGDAYFARLQEYVRALELEADVIFTGHTRFPEILAYYRLAHVFVSMTEHEGFCIPLVEAMYFGIPIVAYDCSAVGETLGGSGLLLLDKSPDQVAEAIQRLVSDPELRKRIVDGEKKRLQDFSHEKIKARFLDFLERVIEGDKT